MKKIILVTGGARSGKSRYAEQLALSLAENPCYVATSRIWDEEFAARVRKHQQSRGPRWTNFEKDKFLSELSIGGRVAVIDCMTLWATNFFFDFKSDVEKALEALKNEFDRFTGQDATFIFVTNEIGMGETSANEIQRKFTDLQGWFNQYVASKADRVVLMVSGIPLDVKNNGSKG